MYGIFFGHLVALRAYRDSDINWTVITPPYMIRGWSPRAIHSTERHGPYRTSTSGLVKDTEGKNEIYVADFARAVIDEVENRQFQRQRFTVGY